MQWRGCRNDILLGGFLNEIREVLRVPFLCLNSQLLSGLNNTSLFSGVKAGASMVSP